MKKILILLIMVLLILTPISGAIATSWAQPQSQTASPFAIEVMKLKAMTDATGNRYYTYASDYEANADSTIYYSIKLTLPSYIDANAYYKTSYMQSGSKVKVVIDYKNVANKERDVLYVQLTDRAQTLWYDGSKFASISGKNYVLSALQDKNNNAKITASVVGNGSLEDIVIANNYKVRRQSYYGVRTCPNCNPTNLIGYTVYGAHAAHDVFLSVSGGKLSGVYVIDKHQNVPYQGAKVRIEKNLFHWVQSGTYSALDGVQYPAYSLQELFIGTQYNKDGGTLSAQQSDGNFIKYCEVAAVRQELRDINGVYYMDADGVHRRLKGTENFWKSAPYYRLDGNTYTAYNNQDPLIYGNVYYDVAAYTETAIHKMTSPTSVDNDSHEKGYLNSANYVLSILGLSFSDIGVAYMSDDLWLENFGYKSSKTSSADWAYVAPITAIPVTSVPMVPATGDSVASNILLLFMAASAIACLAMMCSNHTRKP